MPLPQIIFVNGECGWPQEFPDAQVRQVKLQTAQQQAQSRLTQQLLDQW